VILTLTQIILPWKTFPTSTLKWTKEPTVKVLFIDKSFLSFTKQGVLHDLRIVPDSKQMGLYCSEFVPDCDRPIPRLVPFKSRMPRQAGNIPDRPGTVTIGNTKYVSLLN